MVHIVCTIENQSVLHRVFHTQRKKREMNKKKTFFLPSIFFRSEQPSVPHFLSKLLFWVVISFDYVSFLSIFGWFSVRVLFLSTNGKNVLKRWLLFCSSRWFFVLYHCLCLCLSRIFSAFNSFFFYLCPKYTISCFHYGCFTTTMNEILLCYCQHQGNLRIIFSMRFFFFSSSSSFIVAFVHFLYKTGILR